MLSVTMLNVIMLNVIMLNVIMLKVIMLIVIMLSVEAPSFVRFLSIKKHSSLLAYSLTVTEAGFKPTTLRL